MTKEELKDIEQDFSQAMRQWKMYWDMNQEEDIETKTNYIESVFYCQCKQTLEKLRKSVRDKS